MLDAGIFGSAELPLRSAAFTGGSGGGGGSSAIGVGVGRSWADALKDVLSGLLNGRDALEVVQEAGGVEEQVDPFLMLGIDHEEGQAP